MFLRRFIKTKLAVIGAAIVVLIVLTSILAGVIAPHDPYEIDADRRLTGPRRDHLFGTDEFGRDIFSRVIHGSRISLQVGFVSCFTSIVLGAIIGSVAGYYGGVVDNILMRMIDSIWSIPYVLLTIVLVAMLGPGLTNVMIAIGIAYTPPVSRITRSLVLEAKENLYVESAKVIGKSHLAILVTEILPNCINGIIVYGTVVFADAIIIESGLSFIGLGAQPPTSSWGVMLKNGVAFMAHQPFVVLFPALAISLSTLGFNLLGDGLRDLFDPRLRRL
ncbi:ABC transporter permease [Candidatus Bipolaricaulota bacterium]|nr:ABC transporter permease [Candidatus Bipolaricaulota bacterium]